MESTLLHPPLVHFAIVLPMVTLIFQLAYSVTNNYIYSQWSARLLILSGLVMIAAWWTGGLEGQDVYPMLSELGQESLKEHKAFGFYIMIATSVLAVLKLVACKTRNVVLETIVFIGLLGTTSALAYQGLLGGDVVYKHGANVQDHSDGLDCLADPADFIEEAGDKEE